VEAPPRIASGGVNGPRPTRCSDIVRAGI
jgi:hypothetical protein